MSSFALFPRAIVFAGGIILSSLAEWNLIKLMLVALDAVAAILTVIVAITVT